MWLCCWWLLLLGCCPVHSLFTKFSPHIALQAMDGDGAWITCFFGCRLYFTCPHRLTTTHGYGLHLGWLPCLVGCGPFSNAIAIAIAIAANEPNSIIRPSKFMAATRKGQAHKHSHAPKSRPGNRLLCLGVTVNTIWYEITLTQNHQLRPRLLTRTHPTCCSMRGIWMG